ncbi:MAG: hypothetical protein ACMUHU_05045 [Thermoplasmatota archaeon]
MDKPYVIRFSEEETNAQETPEEQVMVDRVVSYFSRPDPEGHKRWWKKRKKTVEDDKADYYYV